LTWLLLGASVVVAFMSDFGDDRSHRSILQDLLFSSFRHTDDGHIQWWSPISPRGDLRRGQYWRLVTPIFVHFGTPHLLMNMFALISLGTVLEARRGTWRFGLLVLVTAVTSNVAEYAWSQIPTFGGMSGVLFGVFGYLWIKSEFDPGFGIRLAPTSIAMMLIWFVLCMTTNWFGSIANAAHFAGLVTGIVWSGAPLVWRRFRSR
jgi:GlpG protein